MCKRPARKKEILGGVWGKFNSRAWEVEEVYFVDRPKKFGKNTNGLRQGRCANKHGQGTSVAGSRRKKHQARDSSWQARAYEGRRTGWTLACSFRGREAWEQGWLVGWSAGMKMIMSGRNTLKSVIQTLAISHGLTAAGRYGWLKKPK